MSVVLPIPANVNVLVVAADNSGSTCARGTAPKAYVNCMCDSLASIGKDTRRFATRAALTE